MDFLSRIKLLTLLYVFLFAACGGGSESAIGPLDSPNGDSAGSTGGDATAPDIFFGTFIDGSFRLGEIGISVSSLSAGGTAEVVVNLVDSDNEPLATGSYTVNFTSGCVADGTATLEAEVDAVFGQASSEYVAMGCSGSDEIRATVDLGAAGDGSVLSAVGIIVVEKEEVGTIDFVSAEPNQIFLAGTGNGETSKLTFKVNGQAGNPIEGAEVDFSLNSNLGGLTLNSNSDISNSLGEVFTTVRAGSVATAVRVRAKVRSSEIENQSSELIVSTGIPDSDSFSMALSEFCPEGLNRDGSEVGVTVRAADAFNNPVPVGTPVQFYAQGGSIDPSCNIGADGACSVTWRSQDPRPSDGRVILMAHTLGNESFTDANGNGRFDDAEQSSIDDLGEPFADTNRSGGYDSGEVYYDFNGNGMWDASDTVLEGEPFYNGFLCADDATKCSGDRSIFISAQATIAMSGSYARQPALYNTDTLNAVGSPSGTPYFSSSSLTVGDTFYVYAQDTNGNSLPCGTTILVEVSAGLSINGVTNFEVLNVSPDAMFSPGPFTITKANNAEPLGTSETVTLTFTSPAGIPSIFVYDNIVE